MQQRCPQRIQAAGEGYQAMSQNELTELYRLSALASAGDTTALATAVELAKRVVLEQELASAPAGVRAEALAGLAALRTLQRQRAEEIERAANARCGAIAKKEAKEALVLTAINNIRAKLEGEVHTNHVNSVWEHLENKKETLGYQYDELPSRKVVKRVLKSQGL